MSALPLIEFPYPDRPIVRILTRDVGIITNLLPDVMPYQYYADGTAQVDVAWEYDNMVKLTMLLQPAISTLFKTYTFPGFNRPYYHQVQIAEFLTRTLRGYCFAGMGTGKTRGACWAADYLLTEGIINRVLVVCPKNLMYSAWSNDIMATCLHQSHNVIYGDRKKREALLERDTVIDIINFDGVELMQPLLLKKRYGLIIIDESTAYKDPSTRRWKALAPLIVDGVRVWALTGTPTPQGAMDAYGQGKLITPERMGRTKSAFRSEVQIQLSRYVWKDRPDWQETVRKSLQPAIYIKKSECLDLPKITRLFRQVELSKPQKQALESLRKHEMANFTTGQQVTVANAAVLHGKLRQIYTGALYADDNQPMVLDNHDRIRETIECIKQAKVDGDDSKAQGKPHSKSIVFVPFKHAMDVLYNELKKHFDVAIISGDCSLLERTRILDKFQTTNSPQVILAIPEAFSHGVTATAASCIVWFAPPVRTEIYLQACERTDRPGQTQLQTIVHLYGDNNEMAMYNNLINNQQNQEALLKMYRTFVVDKETTL